MGSEMCIRDRISDNVVSNIKEYAERVKIYDDDDERNPGPSDDGAN